MSKETLPIISDPNGESPKEILFILGTANLLWMHFGFLVSPYWINTFFFILFLWGIAKLLTVKTKIAFVFYLLSITSGIVLFAYQLGWMTATLITWAVAIIIGLLYLLRKKIERLPWCQSLKNTVNSCIEAHERYDIPSFTWDVLTILALAILIPWEANLKWKDMAEFIVVIILTFFYGYRVFVKDRNDIRIVFAKFLVLALVIFSAFVFVKIGGEDWSLYDMLKKAGDYEWNWRFGLLLIAPIFVLPTISHLSCWWMESIFKSGNGISKSQTDRK